MISINMFFIVTNLREMLKCFKQVVLLEGGVWEKSVHIEVPSPKWRLASSQSEGEIISLCRCSLRYFGSWFRGKGFFFNLVAACFFSPKHATELLLKSEVDGEDKG